MTTRALWALAAIAACGGCRLDASGLGDTDISNDATVADAIAVDASSDTAELADNAAADSNVDALADADATRDSDSDTDADAPTSPVCDSADPELIGCYRFSDAEHPAQPWDESMYAHNGTSSGVTFAPGKVGRAMVVTSASYVNVPERTTLGVSTGLTIELWIRPRILPTTTRVGLVDADNRYGLFLLPGGIVRSTAPAVIESAAVIKVAEWQHIAVTYSGAKLTLYINGAVVNESTVTGGAFGPGSGAGLALGMNSPSGEQFDGLIDSVRIFRVGRTAMQICGAAGSC